MIDIAHQWYPFPVIDVLCRACLNLLTRCSLKSWNTAHLPGLGDGSYHEHYFDIYSYVSGHICNNKHHLSLEMVSVICTNMCE